MFPEVGSTRIDLPGVMSPRFSASSIMLLAMRSLTELQGSMLSNFKRIFAGNPAAVLPNFTIGVAPMRSTIDSAILGLESGLVDIFIENVTQISQD